MQPGLFSQLTRGAKEYNIKLSNLVEQASLPAIKYTIFITTYSYTQMPEQENLKLITTLESAITGLNKADWEYPFGTYLWDVSEKGAFSIEKIFDIKVVF